MVGNKFEFRNSENDIALNEYWGELLNKRIPGQLDYKQSECFGIIDDGQPVVAWSYNSFKEVKNNNIQELECSVSIASFRGEWKPFKVIPLILSLFFKNKCYNRLTALTSVKNRQAVRLLKLAGFTLEGIIRKPASVDNIMQFSLLREEYVRSRWVM